MFDTCPLDAGAEVIAQFILIMSSEFTSRKCGHFVRFYRMDGRSCNSFIDRFHICLMFENDVRGIFNLHEAPVIGDARLFDHRATEPCIFIKTAMKSGHIQVI